MALLLASAGPLQKVARQLPARHMGGAIVAEFAKAVSTAAAVIGGLKIDCVNAKTG